MEMEQSPNQQYFDGENARLRNLKVFVYYNLHKHCLSVRAQEGLSKGRIVLHAQALTLRNVSFRVSEAGRQRVLRERCKNVHAGLLGQLWDWVPLQPKLAGLESNPLLPSWRFFENQCRTHRTQVTYDPYKFESFVTKLNEIPVFNATVCALFDRAVYI
jgi:hypothetical protein